MLLNLAPRIIGRESSHLINTIRGLAFIIALIVGVFGLINGLSIELARMANLAGQSNYLYITASNSTCWEDSKINPEIITFLNDTNIKLILSETIIPVTLSINFNNVTLDYSSTLYLTNITEIYDFWENSYISDGDIPTSDDENLNVLIGNNFLNTIELENIPVSCVLFQEINTSDYHTIEISGVLNVKSHLSGALITSYSVYEFFWHPIEYYSLIEIQLFDATAASQSMKSITQKTKQAGYDVRVHSEMKSNELITETFREIVQRFQLFSLLLFFIVTIRIYNATVWLTIRFEREVHILRALGATPFSVVTLFLFSSLIIGNLALLLGIILGLFLPFVFISILDILMGVGFVFSAIKLQNLLEVIIIANIAFFGGTIMPSISITRKKSLKFTE